MAQIHGNTPPYCKLSGTISIHQDDPNVSDSENEGRSSNSMTPHPATSDASLPMTTSKLANQQAPLATRMSTLKKINPPINIDGNNIGLFMGRKPQRYPEQSILSNLRPKSSTAQLKKPSLIPASVCGNHSSAGSTQAVSSKLDEQPNANNENSDVVELKKELEEAKKQIAGLNQQISQQNVTQQTMEQVLTTPAPTNVQLHEDPDVLLSRLSLRSRPKDSADDVTFHDPDTMPQALEGNSAWGDSSNVMFGKAGGGSGTWDGGAVTGWNGSPAQGHSSSTSFDMRVGLIPQHMNRAGSGNSMGSAQYRGWNAPFATSATSLPSSTPPVTPFEFSQGHNMGSWQPRPGAASFTPTGPEFSNPWNTFSGQLTQATQQQYMPPVEPMNYRRLLDRNVSCNWKYIVDKIICSNDQQASIFLQQKLKVSSSDLKYDLIESIIAQAYPLMINRFGNFLVQRCLEHGTPEQVNAIANVIRGKTLDLSMDAFGCHVVQKAFDVVPETYKASMVHELLRQIPQTVVHRYACHVWQKLFELRWSDSPPQIMKCVNEALRGMWHEVALGETGSLVVQNIFENCLDEDKRPCISEVLAHIDIIAHGQFGNWCIQHICEHGAPADKKRAIEHVLLHATEYSTDQFASKVVEKCLKVAGPDFLERYLEKVCEARPDRPRMPLIDIAGDQYGNYLVQFILLNADNIHREAVAQNIRKHMVSLRGSKFGSRVAMLCNNPAVSTRPGPPVPFVDRAYQQYTQTIGRSTIPGSCR